MNNKEFIELLVWSYQEGYKSAMNVVEHIATDRSQDEFFNKKMIAQFEEMLSKRDISNPSVKEKNV